MSNNATTYAQALVQTALGEWLEQLTSVQRNLRRNPDVAVILSDANSPPTQRESALGQILSRNTAPEVAQFVRLLVQQGDIRLLEDVVRKVRASVPSLSDQYSVLVTSAHELGAADKEKLEAKLRADHGAEIQVGYEVEPELLGGLRIRVGDRVIDHSVSARLDALRARLVR